MSRGMRGEVRRDLGMHELMNQGVAYAKMLLGGWCR